MCVLVEGQRPRIHRGSSAICVYDRVSTADASARSCARYVLHEAEEQGLLLPWACRMGCCTACAVRVVSGHLHQPQASPPTPVLMPNPYPFPMQRRHKAESLTSDAAKRVDMANKQMQPVTCSFVNDIWWPCPACIKHVHTSPQALGVSAGLRSKGYALMCVAYPRSDAVLEIVEVRAFTLHRKCGPCTPTPCTQVVESVRVWSWSDERRVCLGSSVMLRPATRCVVS